MLTAWRLQAAQGTRLPGRNGDGRGRTALEIDEDAGKTMQGGARGYEPGQGGRWQLRRTLLLQAATALS